MKIRSITSTAMLLFLSFFAINEASAQSYTSQQQQICNWNSEANANNDCFDLAVPTSIVLNKTEKTLVIESAVAINMYKIVGESIEGTIEKFEMISSSGILYTMKLNVSTSTMELTTSEQSDPLYRLRLG